LFLLVVAAAGVASVAAVIVDVVFGVYVFLNFLFGS